MIFPGDVRYILLSIDTVFVSLLVALIDQLTVMRILARTVRCLRLCLLLSGIGAHIPFDIAFGATFDFLAHFNAGYHVIFRSLSTVMIVFFITLITATLRVIIILIIFLLLILLYYVQTALTRLECTLRHIAQV